jgi:hypothetical protein
MSLRRVEMRLVRYERASVGVIDIVFFFISEKGCGLALVDLANMSLRRPMLRRSCTQSMCQYLIGVVAFQRESLAITSR